MECVDCGGKDCRHCGGTEVEEITCCPLDLITADVWELIRFAELYEKGLPPVAGGALDQAKIFIEAAALVFEEQAFWKKKLGVFD